MQWTSSSEQIQDGIKHAFCHPPPLYSGKKMRCKVGWLSCKSACVTRGPPGGRIPPPSSPWWDIYALCDTQYTSPWWVICTVQCSPWWDICTVQSTIHDGETHAQCTIHDVLHSIHSWWALHHCATAAQLTAVHSQLSCLAAVHTGLTAQLQCTSSG